MVHINFRFVVYSAKQHRWALPVDTP
jgi:hypothetical protein